MEILKLKNIVERFLVKYKILCRTLLLLTISIVFLIIAVINYFEHDYLSNVITSNVYIALTILAIIYILFYEIIMNKKVIASFMILITLILFYLPPEIELQAMPNFKNLFLAMILLSLGSFAINLLWSMIKFLSEIQHKNKFLLYLEVVGALCIFILIGALFYKGLGDPLKMIF